MEPHVQQALLTDVANVLRHLAREIPTELVQAGATEDAVERAKTDAQTIVDTVVADMTPRDIDILLHFDPMSLALQFIGADDRALAFSAADGPYEAYREQFGEAQVPEATAKSTTSRPKADISVPLIDEEEPISERLIRYASKVLSSYETLIDEKTTKGDPEDESYVSMQSKFSIKDGRAVHLKIISAAISESISIFCAERKDGNGIEITVYFENEGFLGDARTQIIQRYGATDETSARSALDSAFRLPQVQRFLRYLTQAA